MGGRNALLVAATLEKVDVGDKFTKVPLHVTIMPWFEVDDVHVTSNAVQRIVSSQAPIEIIGEEEAMFGPNHDVRVRRVGSQTLHFIHNRLLKVVRQSGAKMREDWVGDNYKPHVTFLDGKGLGQGDVATLNAIQIFSRSKKSSYREVKAVHQLT